jgi:hypothetical protein
LAALLTASFRFRSHFHLRSHYRHRPLLRRR